MGLNDIEDVIDVVSNHGTSVLVGTLISSKIRKINYFFIVTVGPIPIFSKI